MEFCSSPVALPRLVFSPPDHEKKILELLNQQRREAKFCDVVLEVDEAEIAAHRAVLSASIPLLAQILSSPKESLKVKLEGLKHEAVEAIVDYLYTSRLDVGADDVLSVYHAARTLEMNELVKALEDFIRRDVLPQEWLGVREFALRNDCHVLLTIVDEFLAKNIEVIYLKQAFLKLPRLQVELTSRHGNLRDTSLEPKALCELAVQWVYSRMKEEDLITNTLLEQSHIMYLSEDGTLKECTVEDLDADMEKFVATEAQVEYIRHNSVEQLTKNENHHSDDEGVIILENNNIRKRRKTMVDEAMFSVIAAFQSSESDVFGFGIIDGKLVAISSHQQLSCHNSVSSESSGYDDWTLISSMGRGRCSVGAAELGGKLYAVGGYDRGDCLDTVEFYDPQTNEWMPAANLNSRRGRLEIAIVGDKMFAVGGSNGHEELNSTECYDGETDTWNPVAPMNYSRSNFGITTIGSRVYAVGGYQGSHNLKTAEMYIPEANRWQMIAPMSCGRDNLCVATLNEKMYVIGGYNGWAYFNTVEVYDPNTDSWTLAAPMKTARRGAGAAAVDGYLYVVGGYDGTSFLNTCERYDPETNEWTTIASMNTPRHNVGVAVVGGLIYAVAGFNGTAFLKTMEYLDPKTGKWCSFVCTSV